MKKQSSKNLKVILTLLVFSSEAVSAAANSSLIPKSEAHYEETQKAPNNALNGASIDSCQTISESWKNNNRNLSFTQYMNIELAKAAQKAENRLYEDGGKEEIEDFYFSNPDKYKEYITAFQDGKVPQEEGSDGSTYPEPRRFKSFVDNRISAFNAYAKTGLSAIEKIEECIALHTVISKAPKARGMDFSEYNKSQTAQSYDGKLKCESIGYETQDYKACSEATTYYDAVFLGRKAVETVQSFQYMDSSMDIQTDLAKNAQTDATAGLKAQQEDIQVKADMARTRAATETAAVGALWVAMGEIPELETLTDECNSSIGADNYNTSHSEALTLFREKLVKLKENLLITDIKVSDVIREENNRLEGACNEYIANTGGSASHALIQNSGAKQIIQQALIDSGVNIATMLGTAEIYDKQASRVGDAIKLVDEHDPETLTYDSEDLLATECQVNPGSENCVSAQYERGVGYHNDGISVSGMQFATSDSTLPIDEYERNTDAATDNTNRTNTVGGIGSTVDPVDKGSGLADSPIGAASVSSTGSNGLGSGGGGGGSGGGGASAPANGSARTGGQNGSTPYVGSSKKLKYSSSGGGLSFSSGSRRVASKTKAENPFSKLFGKKDAKSNGVLNFRGVASDVGTKNGSIFQMISKRYSAVSKDNRLEEYQKVNK